MEQEIKNGTYIIPEGFTAKIEDRKIIVEKKESEDERIRKELLAVINDLILPDEQKTRFNAYLEKQKEQKPAEWSEEDEEMKQSIIDYLESKQVYAHSRTNMIVWLKSLRSQPHWKPSEEQMKLLRHVTYLI